MDNESLTCWFQVNATDDVLTGDDCTISDGAKGAGGSTGYLLTENDSGITRKILLENNSKSRVNLNGTNYLARWNYNPSNGIVFLEFQDESVIAFKPKLSPFYGGGR